MFRILTIVLILAGCASGPDNRLEYNPKAATANADLGKSYMQRGDYELAMAKFKRALRYDSESAEAHHYIAELYRRLGKSEDADRHYKQAINYSTNDSALFNNYGVYLCGEGRIDEAKDQFDRVLKNPVYRFPGLVYENMGLCMLQNGLVMESEENFRKAITINPEQPKSLFELAKISFQRERYFSARAFITRYSKVSQPSAESLWLAIEIETALKDHQAVKDYGQELVDKFPLSKKAEKYQRLNRR